LLVGLVLSSGCKEKEKEQEADDQNQSPGSNKEKISSPPSACIYCGYSGATAGYACGSSPTKKHVIPILQFFLGGTGKDYFYPFFFFAFPR
jgi:hypothetical protein